MVKLVVPPSADVVKKWVEETPKRAVYYEKVTPARASMWESNTVAAASTFKAAVQATDIDKRFSGGVKRAGAAKFARKVTAVGVARFGPGVTAAEDDYSKGVDPYLKELAAVDVPARKPRGDPGNLDRVKAIMDALHKKRLAQLAAGPS
jgi:hypothetical protein